MTLDLFLLGKIFVVNIAYVMLTLPFPFLFTIIMPTVMVSMVLLPIGFVMYAYSLLMVGVIASILVSDERRNDSLDLLRVSPRPMLEVLYSKIAAAIWRQLENFSLVLMAVALFSLPILMIRYDMIEVLRDQPLLLRLVLIVALASTIVRVFLEVAMIGAIGAVVGATTTVRASAVMTTAILGVAYFAFINLARLLPLSVEAQLLVEIVLPLLVPPVITVFCLRLASHLLTRDA